MKWNPGKWNETLKYYSFLLHCFLQKGSTSEAKNLTVKKHTFLRKSTKIFCVGYLQFSGFFPMVQVHSQQLYCHLWQNARAQFKFLQYFHFFFLSQDFHSISHTAIFLIWFLVCGCTTHALHILLFVSVCICFNKAKLENVFSFSRYLILFCLNGPVCIFDAWKIKCNWGSQQ